jgi:hypothetical protein
MEPEGSLPCPQQPATGTYTEPDEILTIYTKMVQCTKGPYMTKKKHISRTNATSI